MGFGAVNVDLNPGGILKAIFDGIDSLVTSDEERLKLKQAAIEAERSGRLDDLKARLSTILTEAGSSDKWTSRARPSFMYVMYVVILSCLFGAVAGVWYPTEVEQASIGFSRLFGAIPDAMWGAFTAGYLGYSYFRTEEKK